MSFLQDGEIEILGRITDASNATLLGQISGEKIVYKPIAGERPLWDFPTGNLAWREFAAFLVSEELGLHVVPETVLRDGPYGVGMVQAWCEPNPEIDVIEVAQSDNKRIREIALFDAIINNGDRKFGHILPVTADEIFGCDHGVTFNAENRLRTVLWQWRGNSFSDVELEALNQAINIAQGDLLSEYLTLEELTAMQVRCTLMIKEGVFPFPSEDWPAVPWPPF